MYKNKNKENNLAVVNILAQALSGLPNCTTYKQEGRRDKRVRQALCLLGLTTLFCARSS